MFNDKPKWRHNTNVSNGCRCCCPEPTCRNRCGKQDKNPWTNGKYYTLSQQINKSRAQKKTIIESIPNSKKRHREHNEPTKKTVFPFFCQAIWNVENKNPASIFALLVWMNAANIDSYGILNEKVHVKRSMRFRLLQQHFFSVQKKTKKKIQKIILREWVLCECGSVRRPSWMWSSAKLESAVNLNR